MDRKAERETQAIRSFSPRTRGWTGGRGRGCQGLRWFSPRTRGWTARQGQPPEAGRGFPRARGDGPPTRAVLGAMMKFSPRTRGWTVGAHDLRVPSTVFPAHAGMDRTSSSASRRPAAFSPRTRGWTVRERRGRVVVAPFSPRTRGWTDSLELLYSRCQRFPRARGDGPGPRPRRVLAHVVFPAHAGMDRLRARPQRFRRAFSPRTRGWTGVNNACSFCS